jgi:hypothetical protein
VQPHSNSELIVGLFNIIFGWLTHNSFEIHLLDGTLHLYFQGKSISADGFKFEYNRAFQTYKTMLEYISDLHFSYVEWIKNAKILVS